MKPHKHTMESNMADLSLFEGGNSLVSSDLFKQLQDADDNLAGGSGGGSGPRRISLRGGRFREIMGGEQVNVKSDGFLNLIVINAAKHLALIMQVNMIQRIHLLQPVGRPIRKLHLLMSQRIRCKPLAVWTVRKTLKVRGKVRVAPVGILNVWQSC